MPISFGSAVGNLLNRLGKCGLLVSQADSYSSSQFTNLIDTVNGLVAQYNVEPDIQANIGSSYTSVLGGVESAGSLATSIAANTINRMTYRDRMGFNTGRALSADSGDTLGSLLEILRQMKGQVTFRPQAVTVTIPKLTFTNATFPGLNYTPGNGVIVTSTRRPSDGYSLQNTLAEDLEIFCTGDSFIDGATAGNEPLSITGTRVQTDPFAFDWPLGSGANISLNAIDGSKDNASGNILTNSGFDKFTIANRPDKWEIVTGTVGTHILREVSLVYDNGSALKITGDGSNLTTIRQKFGDWSVGTSGTLKPLTQYSHNLFTRADGNSSIAAGVLRMRLVDGNGATINDAFTTPNANSTTIDLTTINNVYTAYNVAFRTPPILPPSMYLEYALTTAITNGRSIFIDKASMGLMNQTITHGIFASSHSGSVLFKRGDRNLIRIANGRGLNGTFNTFATLFYRLFDDCRNNEIIFPYAASAGAETILDTAFIV